MLGLTSREIRAVDSGWMAGSNSGCRGSQALGCCVGAVCQSEQFPWKGRLCFLLSIQCNFGIQWPSEGKPRFLFYDTRSYLKTLPWQCTGPLLAGQGGGSHLITEANSQFPSQWHWHPWGRSSYCLVRVMGLSSLEVSHPGSEQWEGLINVSWVASIDSMEVVLWPVVEVTLQTPSSANTLPGRRRALLSWAWGLGPNTPSGLPCPSQWLRFS